MSSIGELWDTTPYRIEARYSLAPAYYFGSPENEKEYQGRAVRECYTLEFTKDFAVLGIGFMRYSADTIVFNNAYYPYNILNVIYNYTSESYFVTAGYYPEDLGIWFGIW